MKIDKSNPTRNFQKISRVSCVGNWPAMPIMKIEGGLLMTLDELMVIVTDTKGESHAQYVPAKFTFDGASIPFFLRAFLGKKTDRRYRLASCFHDWCYGRVDFDRRYADELFYFLLIKSGVPQSKAAMFFLAVRTFGFMFKR